MLNIPTGCGNLLNVIVVLAIALSLVACGEKKDAYRVVEIIPAAGQAQESTLEFQIRVLEKENQILTRLLLKEGKL